MHPVITMKSWSHQLHDSLLIARHEIYEHIRSRHFWTGVAVALLLAGIAAALIMLAMNTPVELMEDFPYGPYGPYR